MLFLMPERGSLSGGAFLHTVGYYKECASTVSSKVEEKGSPATSFITKLGA